MSFGWSVGDILGACNFVWQLVQALDDVSGAPEHHRQTVVALKIVHYRLDCLKTLVEDDVDAGNTKDMTASLKASVERLEVLVAKGSGIDAGSEHRVSHLNWAKLQLKKLRWYYGRQADVDGLIQHIHGASAFITDIHIRRLNETINEHFVTTMGRIKAIEGNQATREQSNTVIQLLLKLIENTTKAADGEAGRLEIGSFTTETENPVKLHVGPELGVPVEQASSRLMTLLQQGGVTYESMASARVARVSRLFVDSSFRKTISDWLIDAHLPVLWLYGGDGRTGPQGANVSLAIYKVMMGRKRPTIAFAARHETAGRLLMMEERLLHMLYSLLIQVLHQLEEAAIDAVPAPAGMLPAELSWSSASISMALSHLKHYLGLLPDCICIVDGWNFICSDLSAEETDYVYDFLNIFSRSTPRPTSTAMGSPMQIDVEPGSKGSGVRLLLTSRANVPMLRQMSNDKVHGFDLGGHVGTNSGILRLDTVLHGIKW